MSARSVRQVNEARLQLHGLLVKKLIAKYGNSEVHHEGEFHPVNSLIQAEVDLFMHSHSKVQAGDLSRLERAVRHATKEAKDARNNYRPATSRTSSTPRSATPRSTASTYRGTASSRGGSGIPTYRSVASSSEASSVLSLSGSPGRVKSVRQQPPKGGNGLETLQSRSRPRPSTAGSITSRSHRRQQQQQRQQEEAKYQSGRRQLLQTRRSCENVLGHVDDGGIRIPNSIRNDWLILETYQQVLADEKKAEEDRRAQAAVQQCKEDLERQMQLNADRSEEEKRTTEARRAHERHLIEKHLAHQEELKKSSKRQLLEVKCMRASQILENERRRERERREKQIDDEMLLAECRRKLAEEKDRQLQKRKQIAEALREMNRENVAKLAAQEKQKLADAEEDRRLMKAYEERLDRDQAERMAAHSKRLERYEMIGNHWAESGAGKRQRDKEIAEERRILEEAAIKEKADQDRENRDKNAIRLDRLRCLEDNKRLVEEKSERKKAEAVLEAEYAQRFRSEGEEHAAKELGKRKEAMREKKAYGRVLKDQMRTTRSALRMVQMTQTERQINGDILRRLHGSRDLQEKISRRLLQQESALSRG